MSVKPLVVLTDDIAPIAARWLAESARVMMAREGAPEFASALEAADGLVLRTGTTVDDAFLMRAPRLRVIGRAGVGLDRVDVGACRRRDVSVVYTPAANTQAVVEYVLLLIVTAVRPIIRLWEAVDVPTWRRLRTETVGRRQLSEMTVGILGLGRIGRGVARAAAGIGATVIYNDLLDIPPSVRSGATAVDVETLFTRSDVVSIHVDGRPSNVGFVGRRLVDRLSDRGILVNTSRGFVVDKAPLAEFLRDHPGAQAHLDVHEPEPFDERSPLVGLANAHLYPHLASRTETALVNMSWVVRDVVAVLEGRAPRFPASDAG